MEKELKMMEISCPSCSRGEFEGGLDMFRQIIVCKHCGQKIYPGTKLEDGKAFIVLEYEEGDTFK